MSSTALANNEMALINLLRLKSGVSEPTAIVDTCSRDLDTNLAPSATCELEAGTVVVGRVCWRGDWYSVQDYDGIKYVLDASKICMSTPTVSLKLEDITISMRDTYLKMGFVIFLVLVAFVVGKNFIPKYSEFLLTLIIGLPVSFTIFTFYAISKIRQLGAQPVFLGGLAKETSMDSIRVFYPKEDTTLHYS